MIPSQVNPEEAQTIEDSADQLITMIESFTQVNLVFTIILGATASELFAALRQFQFFTVVSMIYILYPGNLMLFYKILLIFAELDMLQGPAIYEAFFEFRETRPYTDVFENFGTGDMNFFFNSGSVLLVILLMLLYFSLMKLVLWLTKDHATTSPMMRKVAILADRQSSLWYPLLKMMYEGAIELTMPATLGMIAILSSTDAPTMWCWFDNGEDAMCSFTTIAFFAAVLTMPFFLQNIMGDKERLLDPTFQQKYGAVYEDYNIHFKSSRTFVWFDFSRRVLVCFVSISLDGYTMIQTLFFIIQSLATMWFMAGNKNLNKEPKMLFINFVNESFLWCVVVVNPVFLLEHEDDILTINFRERLGIGMIGLLTLNMIFNLLAVAVSVMMNVQEFCVELFKLFTELTQGNEISRRQLLIDTIGNESRLKSLQKYIDR